MYVYILMFIFIRICTCICHHHLKEKWGERPGEDEAHEVCVVRKQPVQLRAAAGASAAGACMQPVELFNSRCVVARCIYERKDLRESHHV